MVELRMRKQCSRGDLSPRLLVAAVLAAAVPELAAVTVALGTAPPDRPAHYRRLSRCLLERKPHLKNRL